MTTWRDVAKLHLENPTWTAKELAKQLGCSVEQVFMCKQRFGLKIPRVRHRDVNPNNVIALGKQARRAGLTLEDLIKLEESRPPKLTQQDVAEIEAAYTGKRGEQSALAKQYGVSKGTIRKVLDGSYWDRFAVAPRQEAAE
jgi:hypothetical protein